MSLFKKYEELRNAYYDLLRAELKSSGVDFPEFCFNDNGETFVLIQNPVVKIANDNTMTMTTPARRERVFISYGLSKRTKNIACTVRAVGVAPLMHDIKFVMSKELVTAWQLMNVGTFMATNYFDSQNEIVMPTLEEQLSEVSVEGLTSTWSDHVANELPIIKTPYQGLNELLGSRDGINYGLLRGEFVGVIGFKNSYKQELLKDMHLGYGLYNDITPIDSTRKPIVIQILTKESMDTYSLQLREKYVNNVEDAGDGWEHLCRNGLETNSLHIPDCKNYTIYDLFDDIESFEKANYEIHQVIFEDLTHISNLDKDGNPMSLRHMVNTVREFFLMRKTIFITSFEIDSSMEALQSGNRPELYLERISISGRYGNDTRLCQELDCEIFVGDTCDKLVFLPAKHRGFRSRAGCAVYTLVSNESLTYDTDSENNSSHVISPVRLNAPWKI